MINDLPIKANEGFLVTRYLKTPKNRLGNTKKTKPKKKQKPKRAAQKNILNAVDWKYLKENVIRQQRNRELYTPVISLYRWWARRPHVLIGAILDAAIKTYRKNKIRVSDPFSGGGTITFEAARRGMRVYAQDLYPWPTTGLAIGLSKCSKEEFLDASSCLIKNLSYLRASYLKSDGNELSHIIRVRVGECPSCNKRIHLFPFLLISLASRNINERMAFFGCRSCGTIHLGPRDSVSWLCTTCGKHNRISIHRPGVFTCPHCSFSARPKDFLSPLLHWGPIAVQELIINSGRFRSVLRPVAREDPVDVLSSSEQEPDMKQLIPEGLETHRLIESGFRFWGDLYTSRQANILISALRIIKSLEVSKACKDRLALAVIGMAEMPAFLSRWDRYHLKAFEGVANHHYSDMTLVVETNPLSPLGRGTLSHRLNSAAKALDWMLKEIPSSLRLRRLINTHEQITLSEEVVIVTGSSLTQTLKEGEIDLVLTDPPYYGDVQYGELSRLFHFWLSKYHPMPKSSESKEAVPNRCRGKGPDFYIESITGCLKESIRTLAAGGRIILTFHNKKFQAWQSFTEALARAGLVVLSLAIIHAENDADYNKRNGKGMLQDLVLECGRRTEWNGKAATAFGDYSKDIYGLRAMGIALAKVIRIGKPKSLLEAYEAELQKQRIQRRAIE